MITIDLHNMTLAEAKIKVMDGLANAYEHGEKVVRIIHGQGKHSEVFPVIKSFVRRWLGESDFARNHVELVFRGEDGSPYTKPNAGETIVVFREGLVKTTEIEIDDEEEYEARRNSKGIRADFLRKARRRNNRR
ncbi:MAG TPA: Smr/MutS family protein [Bacillota bacterium]|nr:Smr/MutS family protein [Bacillota bacterium]